MGGAAGCLLPAGLSVTSQCAVGESVSGLTRLIRYPIEKPLVERKQGLKCLTLLLT